MRIYAGPAELLDASGHTVAEIDVELYVHDTGSVHADGAVPSN